MNSYELSRCFFDFSFENPEKISPNHAAIFFFALEHCNRLGWKEKFGFPTQMVMDAIGIKKHQTYIKYLDDLICWGFIKLIQKSKNQYSANIISIGTAMPKNGKALDKAMVNHSAKQGRSNGQSKDSIDKHNNIINKEQINGVDYAFASFWEIYPKKVERRDCERIFEKLSIDEKKKIQSTLPFFISFKPFAEYNHPNPKTYLNKQRWNDEIPINHKSIPFSSKTNQLGKTSKDYDND